MTGDALLLRGDAIRLPLRDDSIDLIVTSPPYWALRSYRDAGEHYDGQIGSEAAPQAFLEALWAVMGECWRVLKPTGSCWVNLGDKRSGSGGHNNSSISSKSTLRGNGHVGGGPKSREIPRGSAESEPYKASRRNAPDRYNQAAFGRPKSKMLLPHRFAIGCEDGLADPEGKGWIVRQDICWSKPNGLPESVTDRCRDSHEYLFHLTKQERYFSAVDEIREPQSGSHDPGARRGAWKSGDGKQHRFVASHPDDYNPLGKLPGSVWPIASEPLRVPEELGIEHFAAFPCALPLRCIKGWSPSGICVECGEGRRPVVTSSGLDESRPQARRALSLAVEHDLTPAHIAAVRSVGVSDVGRGAATQDGTGKNTSEVYRLAAEARAALGGYAREFLLQRPRSFGVACACPNTSAPTRPSVILDPFGGTGTTAAVARALGRTGISVDLSADYCRLARWRIYESGDGERAVFGTRPPRQINGQGSMFEAIA